MTPAELLVETSRHVPNATPAELFRLCMLLCQSSSPDALVPSDNLARQLQELQMQLALHEDQHAAVASELDSLASTEPCQFNVTHLWTLIRAIKVQSQYLDLFLGALPSDDTPDRGEAVLSH